MNNVTITEMKLRPLDGGPAAAFSAIVNGVALKGCAVFRHADGFLAAVPPKALSGNCEKKAIWFAEKELHDLFRDRAVAVYQALAGESEPVSQQEPAEEPEDAGVRRFLGEGERESLAEAGI